MKYNPEIHHRRSIRLKGYDYSQAGLYFITICCQDRKCWFGKIVGAGFTHAQNTVSQNKNNRATVGATLAVARMELNEYGKIAYDEWAKLPERFPNCELDVFQIMPNHMHGIIALNDSTVRATLAVAPDTIKQKSVAPDVIAQKSVAPDTIAQKSVAPDTIAQKSVTQNDNVPVAQNNNASDIATGTTARVAPTGAQNDNTRNNNSARVNRTPTIGDIVGAYKSIVSNECLKIFETKIKKAGASPAPTRMGKLLQRNYYEHIIRNEKSYHNISNYIITNPANWKDDKFFME